ncbi:MAG: hypothetical protein ACLFR1_13105 [Spirochaetia bacterium]
MEEQKKDIDRSQIQFHYNREERLSRAGGTLKEGLEKRGFFQKNRSMVILLADIGIIMLIYIIISILFPGWNSSSAFPGYQLRLNAFYYNNQTLIALSVTADDEAPENPALVTVHFKDEAGGFSTEAIMDLMPQPGQTRYFRVQTEEIGPDDRVVAHVESEGNQAQIAAPVASE